MKKAELTIHKSWCVTNMQDAENVSKCKIGKKEASRTMDSQARAAAKGFSTREDVTTVNSTFRGDSEKASKKKDGHMWEQEKNGQTAYN